MFTDKEVVVLKEIARDLKYDNSESILSIAISSICSGKSYGGVLGSLVRKGVVETRRESVECEPSKGRKGGFTYEDITLITLTEFGKAIVSNEDRYLG